jgi:hypothetical protein
MEPHKVQKPLESRSEGLLRNNVAPVGADVFNLGVVNTDSTSTICMIGP